MIHDIGYAAITVGKLRALLERLHDDDILADVVDTTNATNVTFGFSVEHSKTGGIYRLIDIEKEKIVSPRYGPRQRRN